MKLKDITNRFFSKKNTNIIKTVDEKNLGEANTESNSKQKESEQIISKRKKKSFKYRITSPHNFKPILQIKHGTSISCNKIPDWARNNSKIVIEKLN